MRTRRQAEPPKDIWPSYRYGPGGQSGIFNSSHEVPEGWTKKPEPDEVYVRQDPKQLNYDILVGQLIAKGQKIDPTWGKAHLKKLLDELND